jgi:exodeoxyribonuclease-3
VYSGITVINSYVPQGRERESPQYAYKLEWYDRLRHLLETSYTNDKPLIWCGDLNVAPEAIDVHDPKRLLGHVCFNPEVWDAFAKTKTWGLIDVFRKHYPAVPGQYTFFDYRVPKSLQRGLGWRIDHILATQPLVEQSVACIIDLEPRRAEKPSDHTILTAEFSMEEGIEKHGRK